MTDKSTQTTTDSTINHEKTRSKDEYQEEDKKFSEDALAEIEKLRKELEESKKALEKSDLGGYRIMAPEREKSLLSGTKYNLTIHEENMKFFRERTVGSKNWMINRAIKEWIKAQEKLLNTKKEDIDYT